MAAPKKRPTKKYHRILCGKDTVRLVNFTATPQLTAAAGRKLTQEEVVDALIAYAIGHLPEVAEKLPPHPEENDE